VDRCRVWEIIDASRQRAKENREAQFDALG